MWVGWWFVVFASTSSCLSSKFVAGGSEGGGEGDPCFGLCGCTLDQHIDVPSLLEAGRGGGRGQRGGVPCLCGCALVPVCLTCFPVCVCAVFVHATACSGGFTVLVVFRFFYRALLVFSPSRRGFFEICAGVAEAGWTEEELNAQNRRKSDRDALATNKELLSIWREIEKHDQAWLFREPVDLAEVPDYLQVVAHPMGEFWDGGGGGGWSSCPLATAVCARQYSYLYRMPHATFSFNAPAAKQRARILDCF